jgi:hypothetical protein
VDDRRPGAAQAKPVNRRSSSGGAVTLLDHLAEEVHQQLIGAVANYTFQ